MLQFISLTVKNPLSTLSMAGTGSLKERCSYAETVCSATWDCTAHSGTMCTPSAAGENVEEWTGQGTASEDRMFKTEIVFKRKKRRLFFKRKERKK